MADSRHTRAGGGYRTRRTLLSDALWIAAKQAVAREGEIETGTGGPPVANAVHHARRKLRDISFLPEALEYQIVCEFRNRYREFESTSLRHRVPISRDTSLESPNSQRPGGRLGRPMTGAQKPLHKSSTKLSKSWARGRHRASRRTDGQATSAVQTPRPQRRLFTRSGSHRHPPKYSLTARFWRSSALVMQASYFHRGLLSPPIKFSQDIRDGDSGK